MANTTPTFWDVDGQSLQTYARNIDSVGGSRAAPPPTRGEDVVIPYQRGSRYVPKIADSRVISLQGWVRATDADGNAPATGKLKEALYDDNWRMLRGLLFTPGKQVVLRKRFNYAGAVRSAVALASYDGGLEPTMIGRHASRFTVDLRLSDPYFYDEAYSSKTLVTGNNTFVVEGDDWTSEILLTHDGVRNAPRVRNLTNGTDVLFNESLASGDSTTLDIAAYRAALSRNFAASKRWNSKVVHTGAPEWLRLSPGSNTLALSSTSGAGVTTLRYKAVWI